MDWLSDCKTFSVLRKNAVIENHIFEYIWKESNINIVYSDDNENKVIFYDKEDYGSLNVTEGTLYITNNYVKEWYENIFDFTESKITVVLSKNEYKKLDIFCIKRTTIIYKPFFYFLFY